MTYGTDRQGSVPSYSIARQFYSPRPPTHASAYAPAWGRPGRIGSLITWVWQGGLIPTLTNTVVNVNLDLAIAILIVNVI